MRIRYAILLAMLLGASSALAQKQEPPCAADAKKFCAGVKGGGGAVLDCLRKNQSGLTPACKAVMANVTPGARPAGGVFKSCDSEIDKLCKGVEVGGGRVMKCLRSHSDQLSPGCKSALEAQAQRRAAARTPGAATPAPTAKKK